MQKPRGARRGAFGILSGMKIYTKGDSVYVEKPEGTNVNYYLFNEYEFIYNEQAPQTTQQWHHHEHISEVIYIIDGELTVKWREDDLEDEQVLRSGDLVEVEDTPHTFFNHTDKYTRFIALKQVLSGKDQRELFKSDKVLD